MMPGDGFSSPPPSHTAFIHDPIPNPNPNSSNSATKRKRNLPGNPDPDAEVIALSPKSLMATNRFVCEVCSKGFQRDQNLQLHKRGHNLPWKLKQRNKQEVVRRKVYICPEEGCIHHDPSRALGDLTGVKKHFSRKHGEKKWKCEKCSKKYAVQSDWKAHSKVCGTREYKCDCGTIFSRKDSFITHRAFCDALTEDNSRMTSFATTNLNFQNDLMTMMNSGGGMNPTLIPTWLHHNHNINQLVNSTTSSTFVGSSSSNNNIQWLSRSQETKGNFAELKGEEENTKGGVELNALYNINNYGGCPPPPQMSATALLQKATQIGPMRSANPGGFGLMNTCSELSGFNSLNQSLNLSGGMMNSDGLMMMMAGLRQKTGDVGSGGDGNLTRDFLGVEGEERRAFSLQQDQVMKFTCSMNSSSIGFSGSQ